MASSTPPSSAPISRSSFPPPSSTPPPPSEPPIAPNIQLLKSAIPLYIRKTNAHIAHLNRLTTSTPRLDTLLSTLTYTLTLLQHSPLPLPFPLPSPSPSPPLQALSTLISSTRTTLRLLGLFSIYTWAVTFLSSPPKDPILRAITAAQIVACAVYQALENIAFLTDQGVVMRGVKRERVKEWWKWSSRAWMMYVALEGGRLACGVWERKEGKEEKEENEEEEGRVERDKEEKVEREKWWRDVLLNAAYAPMTVHWSREGGVLSEGWIGALGLVAGVVGFRQAWRETS